MKPPRMITDSINQIVYTYDDVIRDDDLCCRMQRFKFYQHQIESGDVISKNIWCFSRKDFQCLIDRWNRQYEWLMKPDWRYFFLDCENKF